MTIPTEPGLYRDIPDEVYHSDHNSLSSSGARTILFDSPNEFRNAERVEKSEYDFGHAAHLYVLGKGARIAIVDAPNWQSKKAQQERAELRRAGLVPLLPKEDAKAREMADVALEHDLVGAYFAEGEAELSGWWIDPEFGVWLRLRLDWITRLPDGRVIVVDYKTSKAAGHRAFAKSAGEYGYFMQAPFYVDGLRALGVEVDDFVFITQCKTKPYRLSVDRIDHHDVALGHRLNRRAIQIFADCMAEDRWPDDSHVIKTASIPTYIRYRAEEHLA
ncbi:PD-(D/E)XK nuclease-like domain-containing protein [Nocardia cyriacigeorgica]|uniref:PD-(D/E)XK nuclease-like domain-containing protein n=1 Tax=Nocardia cyriacigeorgica TaxID=135487 RepID=UPI0024585267|nr:PD-(D/E)XK nuclease-like domain-containing protein [Nocardia cyriacigeorgica]